MDIERGAIDIARLRFWLSIVVDAEQPEPLPNFDYKFMQGNSLIESFEGFDLSRISGRLRGGQSKSNQLILGLDSNTSKQNLLRLLREYFSVTDHQQKDSMRRAINDEVKTLIRESIGGTPASLAKLERMDCSANQDFFLWHTWFKDIFDNGGFDIVIGNPPYVSSIDDYHKELLGKTFPVAKKKIFDLYNFFMVQSLLISKKQSGITSLIVPPSWLNNKNNTKLRSFIAKNGLKQVHYLDGNVFQSAVVFSSIYFTNGFDSQHDEIVSYTSNIKNGEYISSKTNVIKKEDVIANGCFIPQYQPSGLLNTIKKRVKFKCLGEISDIVFGIQDRKSAKDKSYVFRENPNGSYKAVLNGKHIQPYHIEESGLFLDYGDWLWNPRRQSVFETSEKIIVRQVGKYPICALDTDKHYTLNTVYNINVTPIENTKYVLAILNSKIMKIIWKDIFPEQKDVFPRLKKEQLVEIPIPIVTKMQRMQIESIVDRILFEKNNKPDADTSDLEHQIDKLVYDLYGLTEEEIAVIEGS